MRHASYRHEEDNQGTKSMKDSMDGLLPGDLSSGVEVQGSHGLQDLHAAHVLERKQETDAFLTQTSYITCLEKQLSCTYFDLTHLK